MSEEDVLPPFQLISACCALSAPVECSITWAACALSATCQLHQLSTCYSVISPATVRCRMCWFFLALASPGSMAVIKWSSHPQLKNDQENHIINQSGLHQTRPSLHQTRPGQCEMYNKVQGPSFNVQAQWLFKNRQILQNVVSTNYLMIHGPRLFKIFHAPRSAFCPVYNARVGLRNENACI